MQSPASETSLLINAAEHFDSATQITASRVEALLNANHQYVRSFHLGGFDIGPCVGCFDCWVRSPGLCRIPDEAQEIVHAVANAGHVIWITEVSFGGFSARLKRIIDRHIPLILPFFRVHQDLTHHQQRYPWLPPVTVFGFDHAPDAKRERLFRDHVESTCLNLGASGWSVDYFGADLVPDDEQIARAMRSIATPANPSGSREMAERSYRDTCRATASATTSTQRAVILHGSVREAAHSTSRAIAEAMADALNVGGCTAVEIVHVNNFARVGTAPQQAAQKLAEADLLIIASPLYVDTLPALTMRALEMVRDVRRVADRGSLIKPAAPRVAAIINCGFPEAAQTRFALSLVREFAREAGYGFAGGWGIGEAEVIHGRPLTAAGRMARHVYEAILAAGTALAQGHPVDDAIVAEGSKPMMPHSALRMIGTMQWYWERHRLGQSVFSLRARPHHTISKDEWEAMAVTGWARARPLRVIDRRDEADDTVTILFEDPSHDPLRYHAGQYITLEVNIGGVPVRRSYSLSSIPRETELAITVKRVPGGLMSNYIHDSLHAGDLVRSFGPAGQLVVSAIPKMVLLVAGGSGIVPLFSVARDLLLREPTAQIRLIYGAHSRSKAIFGDILEEFARAFAERFHYSFVPAEDTEAGLGERGLLTPALLERLLNGTNMAEVSDILLCGPDAMRSAVRTALCAMGYDQRLIREESFVSPRGNRVTDQIQTIHLVTDRGVVEAVSVKPDQTALDALLDAGISFPFSCLNGTCGTCVCTVLEGNNHVVLDEPNDIQQGDRKAGRVPACIMRLDGPVTITRR